MSTSRLTVALVFLLMAASCGNHTDTDQLRTARHSLRSAPCGSSPAVAGAAGVNADPRHVYLGDWVILSVCHLDDLMKTADAQQAPLRLFVEGVDTGNEPVGIDADSGTLTFILGRNEENRKMWQSLLYDPLFDPEVTIHLSVGIKGERPLPRAEKANLQVQLRKVYIDFTTWIWLALLVTVAIVLVVCARTTDMLRDGPSIDGVRQPYSLGRSQMAWWFFLTVLSYVVIWLVTGDRDTIPPSLLGLMGISAATALAAVAIKPAVAASMASRGWWRDVVTNDQGSVALDRLQVVVWTVVLGGVFLSSVLWELTMPEFNATLLALMGISSGTYIGFQLPQKS
jgi:hypothetical protein